MKKFNLVLVAVVCAASFAFFSCGEKETWTVVEEFAPDAGTYALKLVSEMSQTTETVTLSSTQETNETVVIEGTEADSNVTIKNSSYTAKSIAKFNTEEAYSTMKNSYSGQEGYTFDDSTLTATLTNSGTTEDSTVTYSNFCSDMPSGCTFEKSSLGNWRVAYTYTPTENSSSQIEVDSWTISTTFTLQ